MEIITGVAVVVIAAVILTVGGWFSHEKLGWFKSSSDAETRERLARVEGQLTELKEQSVAPSPGTAPVETEALAAQATARTERLLAEAVAFQRQNKERDAIERLLTAYDMDMPPQAKAQLHLLAGNGFLHLSELEEAEGHYRQAMADAEEAGHRRGQAVALGNLGLIYASRGDLDRAEERYHQALAINKQIGNNVGQARNLGNLGLVYASRGDLDEAEEHHKRALAMHEDAGEEVGQANQLGNLGLVYAERGDLDKAEEHHKRALAIDEVIGYKLGQAQDMGNLGNVYLRRGDLGKAEEHHKKALTVHQQVGNKLGEANQLGNLGSIHLLRHEPKEAEERYRKALLIFEDVGAAPQIAQTQQLIEELRSPKE